jgi:hypothetical protein
MKTRLLLSGLLAVFLVLRLLLLLTNIESTADLEELARGVIAKEILAGLKMPFWDYQIDDYSGGSLAIGLLSVPVFSLLGPSLFALKLTPLFFSLAASVVTFLWVRKKWGAEKALWVLAFFVLAPPHFIRLSLLAMGFHSESILWAALMLGSWSAGSPLAFGIFAGLGLSFCYITGIVFMAGISSSALLDRVRSKPFLLTSAVGFFIGALYFTLYNLTHDLRGIKFLVLSFLPGAGGLFSGVFQKTAVLLFEALPASFGISHSAYPILLLLLFAAGIFSLRKERDLFPIAGSILLFLLLFIISDFSVGSKSLLDFRYFAFLHYFILLVCGLGAASYRWGKFLAAAVLGWNLLGLSGLYFKEPFARGLQYKGYSYYQLSWAWPHHLQDPVSQAKVFQALTKLPKNDRKFLEWGLAYNIDFQKFPLENVAKVFSPENRLYLEDALDYSRSYSQTAESRDARDQGKEAGFQWVYERIPFDEAFKSAALLSSAERDRFFWGVGWAIRREIPEDTLRAEDWLNRIPEFHRSSALEGFQACQKQFQIA